MNTKDTELIFEAYSKKVVNLNITEEEAAQIFERSIGILFEYHNYLIQEGFIEAGKELATKQIKKSFPLISKVAGKAYNTILNVRRGTGQHKELIKHMISFVKAAAQNKPDTDPQLINVVVAALESLPQEKVREIVAQFRGSLVPSVSEIHGASAAGAGGGVTTERFEGNTRRNSNTRYSLIEDVEFTIIAGINREIIRENKAILNAALDIVEEGIIDAAKSGIQSVKSGIQTAKSGIQTAKSGIQTAKSIMQSGPQSTGSKALNILQTALDVAGVEPTVGTAADVGNGLISLLRAAATKEPDQRKKHLLNAAISAVSIIPGADVVKLLKVRKLTKPLAKGALAGAKALRTYKQGKAAAGKIKLATGDTSSNDLYPQAAAKSASGGTSWI